MTYKIKSLIYFSCFLVACLIYYGVEQEDKFQSQMDSKTFVEADFHDADHPLEKPQKDFVAEQE
ncbi:MAG: hypothetical protein R2819_10395 [Allomuricauda sp.]